MQTNACPTSQPNPPCAPLIKGGRNFHVSHKLLNAHYKTVLAPLNKGGWGDSNSLHLFNPFPKIRFSKKERT
jgi:hypothetical protein